MKIVFIGCVDFSYRILGELLKNTGVKVVGVVTRQQSAINSDFRSLEGLAVSAGIPFINVSDNNQGIIEAFIRQAAPDVVYCFGWSYLLRKEILEIPTLGVIGYHPAALPQNRGRHPIIWTLALGLDQAGSTFFFMDEYADSGDILAQEFVKVDPEDDASTLYSKLVMVAIEQVKEFTPQLESGNYTRRPQDTSRANYWRKRGRFDGQIDWRMPAGGIHNLVRALSKPYVGAHCMMEEQEIKIWKTELLDLEMNNIEPGKVLSVENGVIEIKCGQGAIRVLKHQFSKLPDEGCYL